VALVHALSRVRLTPPLQPAPHELVTACLLRREGELTAGGIIGKKPAAMVPPLLDAPERSFLHGTLVSIRAKG
jgi:hypothetical protein